MLVLNKCGFEATAVYSGQEALDSFHAIRPQIIVADVVMPEMNGIQLSVEIRKRHPECRVVFMSGNIGAVRFIEALPPEDRKLLAKPFAPAELVERLQSCLNKDESTITSVEDVG